MTVRPFASFDLGPVGLGNCQWPGVNGAANLRGVIPNNHRPLLVLGLFKCGLRGDQGLWSPVIYELIDLLQKFQRWPVVTCGLGGHLVGKLNKAIALGLVGGGQQISNSEKKQEELDGRTNWIVLVARFDVTEEDG